MFFARLLWSENKNVVAFAVVSWPAVFFFRLKSSLRGSETRVARNTSSSAPNRIFHHSCTKKIWYVVQEARDIYEIILHTSAASSTKH